MLSGPYELHNEIQSYSTVNGSARSKSLLHKTFSAMLPTRYLPFTLLATTFSFAAPVITPLGALQSYGAHSTPRMSVKLRNPLLSRSIDVRHDRLTRSGSNSRTAHSRRGEGAESDSEEGSVLPAEDHQSHPGPRATFNNLDSNTRHQIISELMCHPSRVCDFAYDLHNAGLVNKAFHASTQEVVKAAGRQMVCCETRRWSREEGRRPYYCYRKRPYPLSRSMEMVDFNNPRFVELATGRARCPACIREIKWFFEDLQREREQRWCSIL